MKRSSGVLLHISSLPSPYGIGTLGKEAFRFADWLKRAGQTRWQMLPVGPTSYGDSPYQSPSSFAGNPYFIDLDLLAEQGLLTQEELPKEESDPRRVDYGHLYETRYTILRKAFARSDRAEAERYLCEKDYLRTWALFAALKQFFNGASWDTWPEDIRFRWPNAIEYYENMLREEMLFRAFLELTFDRQWSALKAYAAENGIALIGDIPIYVPYDSAEVWERPGLFCLDERREQTLKAGCPPDAFQELGQLWGNPVYNWEAHRRENFAWWIRRVQAAGERFDYIRLDHFRGLESFWAVPREAPDARPGQWYPGPGMDFVRALNGAGLKSKLIAEDLGFLTPEVKKLLGDSGYPGMRVIQFGFEPLGDSKYLPHNYVPNCVAYLGTHDNSSVLEWFETAPVEEAAFAADYLGLNKEEGISFGFIRGLLNSCADLAVVLMQDVLSLGKGSRMNFPGTTGWWTWRMLPGEALDSLADRLNYYACMSGRAVPKKKRR